MGNIWEKAFNCTGWADSNNKNFAHSTRKLYDQEDWTTAQPCWYRRHFTWPHSSSEPDELDAMMHSLFLKVITWNLTKNQLIMQGDHPLGLCTGCPEICPACGQMCCGACRTLSTFAQIENCPTSVATCRAPRPIRYNQLYNCNATWPLTTTPMKTAKLL